ncbi:replication factor C subunit 1 isoform X1 [Chiloscyllium plagiosum]|uniref:replication factor C subunit 1 isoform X1 n=1 Tax=Chiloscyllium plagiosum TaxID=36176 RepID=UPI001CB85306|nr:replication factor C subunit 1 isoform X1 [Chiloscyllium plagiosum]
MSVQQDIRRFFGGLSTGKKPGSETLERNRAKNVGKGTSDTKKKTDTKGKDSCNSISGKQKPVHRKKHIIYDSDSESEETPPDKKSKKNSCTTKPVKPSKLETVTIISETDEEEDFQQSTKIAQRYQENGGHPGTSSSGRSADNKLQVKSPQPKPASPEKLTCTSVRDYFGTSTVQRSNKKLVASKRKAPSGSAGSTIDDEELARQLQLDEDAELERQLHEDEQFAKTLAMLDELPKSKKARTDSEGQELSLSLVVNAEPRKTDEQAAEHSGKANMLSGTDSNVKNCTEKVVSSKSQSLRTSSQHSPESSSVKVENSFSKSSPVKSSTKLAIMKRKEELTHVIGNSPTRSAQEKRSSPRKEEKTGFSKQGQTKISPKKEEKTVSPNKEKISPNKKKISPNKSESENPETAEKKRQNYLAYRSFLNRDGPRALGSKEIPQGAENCLEGLSFVITGVLESMERDDAKSLIERYGGKLTGNISKKTNYLVTGREGGRAKLDKAESFGTKQIDEDGLLDLIRRLPGKRSKYEIAAENEVKKSNNAREGGRIMQKGEHQSKTISPISKKQCEDNKGSPSTPENGESSRCAKRSILFKADPFSNQPEVKCEPQLQTSMKEEQSLLWVDKYKPAALKNIIGQQGEQSCANKLVRWLKRWHVNNSGDSKPTAKFTKFGGKDDGSSFKAALLSGPPGVGKTTTATLVCKDLGYSYVELNASDARSKNTLKEVIAESLNNTSIKGFSSGAPSVSTKHLLIMDEVDGMAGNEDRGGIQEMISLIKRTKVPILCICNDRNHPKIRSLANYCFDLRFQRPRVEQIKGAMMTVAFKEGLKIPPPAMNEIILAANQDIRQVLHNLSMWCAENKTLTYDQAKENGSKTRKDTKLGPFDVVRKVFATGEEAAHMSLIDKSDLFFHDYSIAPLFVQENYLQVKPAAAGTNMKKHLMLLSKTAESICDGDLVDKRIRSLQSWNLLPTQAIYASVIPGELMRGYMSQFPSFPSWLGKFSSTNKHDRIVQELTRHMCLRTHASKRAVNLDYLPYLRDTLVQPLTLQGSNGAQEAVATMNAYYLMKEDVDSIMEISSWAGRPDPFSKLDPKVKAAFTRTYNRETHLTPYALQAVKKLKRGSTAGSSLDTEPNDDLQTEDVQSEETEDNLELDGMIKPKKPKAKNKIEEQLPQQKGRKDKGKRKATK